MQLTALQPKVWWQNYYFKAFVYGVGISFLFFIPFIIYDKGYFLFTVILTFSKCPSIKWRMTP